MAIQTLTQRRPDASEQHIAGKGNAEKAAVIEAVREFGFQPADNNEADALALLNWAIAHGIGVVQ